MLDERQLKCIELKYKGLEVTKIALEVGISRTTYYKWIELEEYKAEVARCGQELISSTIQIITSYAPINAMKLIKLADGATSKKIELDARLALLNKTMPNTTKLSIDDGRDDKDNVSVDVLDAEMNDIDKE